MADRQPDSPRPVQLEYSNEPEQMDPVARGAVIAGLFFVIPFLPGVLAISFGWLALANERKSPKDVQLACVGIGLGLLNFLVSAELLLNFAR